MGRHESPKKRDTNPFGQIFRDYEPGHTGFEGDADPPPEHTVPPVERTDGGGSIEPYRPDPETQIIRIGAPPVRPFEPDPEPFPDEPGWTQDDADREIADARARPRWPLALGLSVALCAVLGAGALGRATAPGEPVSDVYSPRETATVTVTPKATAGPKRSGGKLAPVPTVTKWRTQTPKPVVKVTSTPGPTIRVTQTVTPKPLVSIRVSRVPVPGPTVTCEITITVNRNEVESRDESGDC